MRERLAGASGRPIRRAPLFCIVRMPAAGWRLKKSFLVSSCGGRSKNRRYRLLLDFRRWERATHKPEFDGEWVRLTELCKPKQWKTIPKASLKQDGYPVYGANGVIGYSDSYNHENETILVGCRGTCGQINVCRPRSYVTGNAMCLDELSEDVDLRYLEQFLRAFDFKAIISGSSQPQITRQGLSKVLVPVRPLDEQRTIADNLGKLSQLENLCERQLSAFDDLVKSQFMEIFSECLGDKVSLSDVVWFQEGPGVRNYQYTAHGVKLLNVANLHDGELDISNTGRYISEEEAYGRYRHFLVEEGDLIIASSGIKVDYFDQKMGFAKKEQLPLCMNTSTIRFRAIDSRLNMIFFMYYLKSDDFKQQLARQITGSAQLNFGPSHLKKMSVPMPPFALQQQFADFVAQVDKLGFDCYREIVCCSVLFSSMSASLLCT